MVIEACVLYTRLLCGKTPGSCGAVCVTAPTGNSAFNIRGSTWHSMLGSNPNKIFTAETVLNSNDIASLQYNLRGVKLFILDEISLVSAANLYEIHTKLQAAFQVLTLFCLYYTVPILHHVLNM